ncbi:MAG: hypothetical protein KF892_08515 [Rhizobacter sp.]|nr:hypothetical protein [Rhizobacter sp.]
MTNLAVYGPAPVGAEVPWKGITARWSALGLSEQPYLYGEVRLAGREIDNLLVLQPVVLFSRRPPEAEGLFRKPTQLTVGIDLKGLDATKTIGSHLILLKDLEGTPTLIYGAATKGLASGWSAMPKPPGEPSKGSNDLEAGPFTAAVTFTSSSDGTLFGKTLSSTLKAQKDDLAKALTPETQAQKDAEHQKAIAAAFDAVGVVLDAQAALDKATDATRPRLALALQKAQYLANLQLQAAGLAPRYNVSGP